MLEMLPISIFSKRMKLAMGQLKSDLTQLDARYSRGFVLPVLVRYIIGLEISGQNYNEHRKHTKKTIIHTRRLLSSVSRRKVDPIIESNK